jgi:hypothetical protein
MKEPAIWIGFVLATFMSIIQSALFPSLFLLSYSPFIALLCMYASFKESLWLSAFSGVCGDLLTSDPLGINAITAVISCAIIFHVRMVLFKEQPLQLCFYTVLISVIWTPIQLMLLFLFDRRLPITGLSLLLDFIEMPLINAGYAFFWFVGPLLIWEWIRSQWRLWRLKNEKSA